MKDNNYRLKILHSEKITNISKGKITIFTDKRKLRKLVINWPALKTIQKGIFFRQKDNDPDRKVKMQEKMRKVNFWVNWIFIDSIKQ